MSVTLGKLDSDMLHDLNSDEPALASKESPGMILSSAREEVKWSIEDVAANLNLRASVIEALESDDYTDLPGPTFVRGYLRSYARLLGIDEAEVVDDDTLISVKTDPIAHSRPVMSATAFRPERQSGGSKSWILWIGLVVLIVVAWSFSGIKILGPDGLLGSVSVGGEQTAGDGSEISLTLDPSSRTGTASE